MGLGTVLGFGVYGIPGLFRIPCIASGSGDCDWIKSAKGVSGTSNQRHAGPCSDGDLRETAACRSGPLSPRWHRFEETHSIHKRITNNTLT